MYPDYLVHFNKNHSSKTGQFTYGDGDSDGQIDERHRYTKGDVKAKVAKATAAVKTTAKTVKTAAKELADQYEPIVNMGKKFLGVGEDGSISGKTVKMVTAPGRFLAGKIFAKPIGNMSIMGFSVNDYRSLKKYASGSLGQGKYINQTTSAVKNAGYNTAAKAYNSARNFYKTHKYTGE